MTKNFFSDLKGNVDVQHKSRRRAKASRKLQAWHHSASLSTTEWQLLTLYRSINVLLAATVCATSAAQPWIPAESLKGVFGSTILAKLLYCSSAWSRFCSAAECARLDSFLRPCQRLGYCSSDTPTFREMFDADEPLFSRILNNKNHVLQSHLPDRPRSQYNLRTIAFHTAKNWLLKPLNLTQESLLLECYIKNVIIKLISSTLTSNWCACVYAHFILYLYSIVYSFSIFMFKLHSDNLLINENDEWWREAELAATYNSHQLA